MFLSGEFGVSFVDVSYWCYLNHLNEGTVHTELGYVLSYGFICFFNNRGVRVSLLAPRLIPRGTCHLPPGLEHMGRNHRVFYLCWDLKQRPHDPNSTSLTTRSYLWVHDFICSFFL